MPPLAVAESSAASKHISQAQTVLSNAGTTVCRGKNGCLGAVLAELRGCVLYLNYDKRFGCLQFPFFSRVPHRLLIWLLLDFLLLLLSFTLLCVLEAAGAPNIYFQFLYEECRRIFYAAPLAVALRTCRSPGFGRDLR